MVSNAPGFRFSEVGRVRQISSSFVNLQCLLNRELIVSPADIISFAILCTHVTPADIICGKWLTVFNVNHLKETKVQPT